MLSTDVEIYFCLTACKCVFVLAGVTQNLIDETRLVPELQMMEDLQKLASEGKSLESTGAQGETVVCRQTISIS